MTTQFTATQIEQLLGQDSYKPVPRLQIHSLTAEQQKEVSAIEHITSFGKDIIELFDHLIEQFQTLPPQSIFIEAGLPIMLDFLTKFKPDIVQTETVVEACKSRLLRSYTSRVTELHLECLFKEHLPHLTVKTHPLLDSIMGVDFIVEDDVKRYYVHVTSNTPFAQKMLQEKEGRGGYRLGRTFKHYSRDFSGDLILKYDRSETDTTMIVNGFPLFNPEFIKWRFNLAKSTSTIGEDLNTEFSKLQHFKTWAIINMNLSINNI